MKDASPCFCINYGKLNPVTVKDANAGPPMDESLDYLGVACIFQSLDANSGYWQIAIDDREKDKATFKLLTLHNGLCRSLPMSFGLEKAPRALHHALDSILSTVNRQVVLV